MITLDDVKNAYSRIAPYVRRTTTVRNHTLSQKLGTNLYLKLELFQKTGSFKPRGAFNKMLRHCDEARERGVVAVSGGNFAQGVAYAGTTLGVRTRIIMPEYTPANYIEATNSYGAEVELAPDVQTCFDVAEVYSREGWSYYHPYDDPEVMEGYGTIGLELLEDVPQLSDVIISVGGGGLMSGITVAIKELKPDVRVWTVETEGCDAMARALQAGEIVQIQPTSLAKTLGAPYVAEDALAIAQQHVESHVVVSDREAIEAQRFLLERSKILTELAASCTLAAAGRLEEHFSAENHVALVLCGGNVSLDRIVEYHQKYLLNPVKSCPGKVSQSRTG
jgi:threonine dehydratase